MQVSTAGANATLSLRAVVFEISITILQHRVKTDTLFGSALETEVTNDRTKVDIVLFPRRAISYRNRNINRVANYNFSA